MLKKISTFLDASVGQMLENGVAKRNLTNALMLVPAMMRSARSSSPGLLELYSPSEGQLPIAHMCPVEIKLKTRTAVRQAFRVESTIRMDGNKLVVDIACYAKHNRTPTYETTIVFNQHGEGRDESL